MKNFKYFFFFILLGFTIPSCVDDDAPEDVYGKGPNLLSFRDVSTTIGGVSNGESYDFNLPMLLKGPSMNAVDAPIEATISIDPSSTAVEGVHFTMETKTITISPDNNYLNQLPITMLTEGIEAPLEEAPVLVLNVETASGETNVIPNGKPLTINFNYLCFSNLAGTYAVTMEYWRFGALVDTYEYTDVIAETGTGEYRTTRVGHWTYPELEVPGATTAGFTFLDVCNEVTIEEQNLVDAYSNLVEGVANKSKVDPETGNIYMEYEICAADCRVYYATYVKQ